MSIQLRAARPHEAELLSELALRSKGHWGYDQSFLDACRAELTFQADELQDRLVFVAESAGRVLGFYSLDGAPPHGELGNMWVEPDSIGGGLGRSMWHHATETARTVGFTMLRIDAEPFAEGFYLAMGAERIGESRSGSIPGRVLPLLEFRLSAGVSSDPALG